MKAPQIEATVDGYRITWAEEGIEATAEWVEQEKRELHCELTVRSTRPMSEGLLLAPTSFNLSSDVTRSRTAKKLSERDRELDWDGMLEQLSIAVRERHRRGEPTIDMRSYDGTDEPLWHLEPYLVSGGCTLLFGDGGAGKTTLAIAIAAALASGSPVLGRPVSAAPVLFLDYEDQAAKFRRRLGAICAGAAVAIPAVHYRRELATLPEAAPVIRREIEYLGVRTVVVDSAALACGGSPEESDVTVRFFHALDSLRVPSLLVHHVTKNGREQTKGFGSAYWHNRPRLSWRVTGRKIKDGVRQMALTEHKHNDFDELPPMGYRLTFAVDAEQRPTAIEIGWADPRGVLAAGLRDQIVDVLTASHGPLLPAAVADMLGTDRHQVGARMSELAKDGTLLRSPDGKGYFVRAADN